MSRGNSGRVACCWKEGRGDKTKKEMQGVPEEWDSYPKFKRESEVGVGLAEMGGRVTERMDG